MQRIFEIDPWKIISHQFKPEDKRLQESMTSIGNEYMGMRGFFEEDYSKDTHKGIYLGGVWYPDKTRVGWWKNGYPEYFGKVINAVDFVSLSIELNDQKVDLGNEQAQDFELSLDMKSGILKRSYVVQRGKAKIKLTFERFMSLMLKELYVSRVKIENLSEEPVKVALHSLINADVYNEDANYDEQFWEVLSKDVKKGEAQLTAITIPNQFGIERFTTQMTADYHTEMEEKEPEISSKAVTNHFQTLLQAKKEVLFEKRVIVTTSRDYQSEQERSKASQDLIEKERAYRYDDLKAAQEKAWEERWKKSDIVIEGDDEAQQGIRFNLFQLFSTYYGSDKRLNIGPKGFTGEKYGGATYWDTEAFALPLFLGAADPEVSLNLLKYRHQQLDGAYHNAKEQGLKGALYPMVTFNGIESHNEWEITFEEIHRNGTIAYAIYNYTRYTGDDSYAKEDGFDVLVSIARFWADRVHFSKRKGVYMIHGVTGPNEYENNVNNNWYTNYLARWVLTYTDELANHVRKEKLDQWQLSEQERKHWREIIAKLYLPYDEELGIFIQNDGYLDKDLLPVAELDKENLPLNQHWSWDKILRSPYIKQADVLQGIYYFMDKFSTEEKERNFDFYEPLTVHESSLSPSIHAVLAADLKKEEKAVEMYERSARLDLDNYNNDTVDGLHITSMTGSWLAIVQGFSGMRVIDDVLHFDPFLPQKWQSYSYRLNFRHRLIQVKVEPKGTTLTLLKGDKLVVNLSGQSIELEEGKNMIKGVAFDLDGVIANTSTFHFYAWRELAKNRLKVTLPDEFEKQVKGLSRRDSLNQILNFVGTSVSEEEFEAMMKEKNDHFVSLLQTLTEEDILPGVLAFIQALQAKKIKIALASASQNGPFILEKLGLSNAFDAIADPSKVKKGKPAPDLYLAAAEGLGLDPKEMVGIEDAIAGVQAIKASGMLAIGIGGEELSEADLLLRNTRELSILLLEKLEKKEE